MKQLIIDNGEVRNGYELNDLSEKAYNKAISDYITFIIETMGEHSIYFDAVKKAEKYKTPWFLHEILWEDYKDKIIDEININNYLFDEEGEVLPITYRVKENKSVVKWKNKYEIQIKG